MVNLWAFLLRCPIRTQVTAPPCTAARVRHRWQGCARRWHCNGERGRVLELELEMELC